MKCVIYEEKVGRINAMNFGHGFLKLGVNVVKYLK